MSMDLMEGRDAPPGQPERDYALERLIMLSDGVFAIAITLLALELRPPEGWDHSLDGLWRGMWRPALAFLVSFVAIAAFWISHRRMFGRLKSADLPLTVMNFVLLGLVTLTPVATNLGYEAGPSRGGFVIYIAVLTLIGVANAAIWGYVAFLKPSLFHRDPPDGVKALVLGVMLIVPLLLPLAGFVSAGRLPLWSFAPVALLAVGMRAMRAHIRRRYGEDWHP